MRLPAAAVLLLALLAAAGGASAADAAAWRNRTIYQLLTDRFALPPGREPLPQPQQQPALPACAANETYCGGTWSGIEARLDYIAGMGFDAVWISPVPANFPREYHGYAARDLFEMNPHFGTPAELRSLVEACHARGIWVMLDVVANHMGIPPRLGPANGTGLNFSTVSPFDRPEHYHSCGGCPDGCWIRDFNDAEQVRLCRLDGLPDLNQTVPFVADTLLRWVRGLADDYKVDGFRVDTVQEVDVSFWSRFQAAAGAYAVGEVDNGDTALVAPYQEYLDGVLSYPRYWVLVKVFAQRTLGADALAAQAALDARSFRDTSLLGSFADNHDNPRMLSYPGAELSLYRNALAYTLLAPGIPIVYYGSEQAYSGAATPENRLPLWLSGYRTSAPLYRFLALVVAFRKRAAVWRDGAAPVTLAVSPSVYAFARGGAVAVLTTAGDASPARAVELRGLGAAPGSRLCSALKPGACFTVGDAGNVTVTLPAGGDPLLLERAPAPERGRQ